MCGEARYDKAGQDLGLRVCHPACLHAWGVHGPTRVWMRVSRSQHLRAWHCECRGGTLVGLTRSLNQHSGLVHCAGQSGWLVLSTCMGIHYRV